jgi:hypothetical protein
MRAPRSISDLDVYARLIALSRELEDMAGSCWSVAGETALRTTARVVRAVASGFFMAMGRDDPANKS